MIKTETLSIQFQHSDAKEYSKTRVTHCMLLDDNNNVISGGTATCNILADQFNKETGRRLSLTRALKESNLNKEARRNVWESYFGR